MKGIRGGLCNLWHELLHRLEVVKRDRIVQRAFVRLDVFMIHVVSQIVAERKATRDKSVLQFEPFEVFSAYPPTLVSVFTVHGVEKQLWIFAVNVVCNDCLPFLAQ